MKHRRRLSPAELIEKQIFVWKQQALEQPNDSGPARARQKRAGFGPYIVISREFGCGAKLVAEELSDWLGWTVFDREIIEEIARDAHVTRVVVESHDESTQAWLEEYVANLTFMDSFTEQEYFRHLVTVVTAIARHGNAILIGRGAQYLLPPESGVRVRLTAPLAQRVRAVAQSHGMLDEEAQVVVAHADSERSAYLQHHFDRATEAASDFDRVFNLSKLSHLQVASAVLEMAVTKLGVALREEFPAQEAGRTSEEVIWPAATLDPDAMRW